MTKDEALKMAIEFIDNVHEGEWLYVGFDREEVINACKEALKQPAQETVGWNEEEFNEIAYAYRICPAHKVKMVSERYQDLVAYVLSLKDKNA
jgi:hypothetical protein